MLVSPGVWEPVLSQIRSSPVTIITMKIFCVHNMKFVSFPTTFVICHNVPSLDSLFNLIADVFLIKREIKKVEM